MELSKALFILISSFAASASASDDKISHQGDRRLRGAGISDDARDDVASTIPQGLASRKDPQTKGVCWNHSEGSICQDGGSFKGVTISGDEILIQEVHGNGKLYSYTIQNEEKFRNDLDKVPADKASKKLAHVLAKLKQPKPAKKAVKYDCKVEDMGEEYSTTVEDNKQKDLLESKTDGTSLWNINGWNVMADSDMNPISIEIPKGEGDYEFSTSITSIGKFSTKDLEGCDPDTEGSGSPEPTAEDLELYFELVNAQNPSISEEDFISGEGRRHLDWITDFSASASNTQWCGPGTYSNTPCPDPSGGFDFEADNACRRHDHGEKIVYNGVGIPRLECAVDDDLRSRTSNWAVIAVYGTFGGASLPGFGCLNYQSYNCWKKGSWWCGWACPTYGYCGKEWATRVGPFRYNGASRTAGYTSPNPTCPEDSRLSYW